MRYGVVPTCVKWQSDDPIETAPRVLGIAPDPRVSRHPYAYTYGASDPALRPSIGDECD